MSRFITWKLLKRKRAHHNATVENILLKTRNLRLKKIENIFRLAHQTFVGRISVLLDRGEY